MKHQKLIKILQNNFRDSPDTILFIMKEIYLQLGIQKDSQIPQNSMTVERKAMKGSVSTETWCSAEQMDESGGQ